MNVRLNTSYFVGRRTYTRTCTSRPRCRYTYENKKNIGLAGSICQFLWHFSSITARVLALSLFASAHPQWIGPVIGANWTVMTSWLVFQQTEACNNRCAMLYICAFTLTFLTLVACTLRIRTVVTYTLIARLHPNPFFLHRVEEFLFCGVLGVIYTFSFFNAKEEPTR